jgi:thiol:disulfide interchange protein DsbD
MMEPVRENYRRDRLPTPRQRSLPIAKRGKPVFVDVTADWCITCLANEAAVLFTPEIKEAFLAADLPYMIADWTDYDADIGEFVKSHGP